MKLLLLSALCFFSVGAFSQTSDDHGSQNLSDGFKKYKGTNAYTFRSQLQGYLNRRKLQGNLLANKQGNVMLLPQDRMPCIVPDKSTAGIMPNAWTEVIVPYRPQYHPIPNPALKPFSFKYSVTDNWPAINVK